MLINRDDLPAAMSQLEQALSTRASGREQIWRTAVDQALSGLARTVRHHARTLMPHDGKLINVDRPRIPSPGVSRRADELKDELGQFVEETRALRARLNASIRQPGSPHPDILAGTLPVASEASAAADLNMFCQRANDLLQELQRYEDDEAHLILDSVNTDIGAGD